MSTMRRSVPNLTDLDWQSMLDQLKKYDPNDGNYYIFTINKGKEDEFKTRFMSWQETNTFIALILEKKRLRIPMPL